jgi:acetyltransferase-like isoleucine patch superfamily enzyme
MGRLLALQIYFLLTGLINLGLAWLPTCLLRRYWLRLFRFDIGPGVQIHRRVRLTSPVGPLSVGAGSIIGVACLLDNRRGISIGSNVNISRESYILTLGHDIKLPDFPTKGAPVCIGDNAWLFMGVKVMPGCSIGSDSVVFPFSMVTKNIPESVVAGGFPARIIRHQDVRRARQGWYGYMLAF